MEPSPENSRAGIKAMLEQIPKTMEATRNILKTMTTIGDSQPADQAELLWDMVNKMMPAVTLSIISLENRIEILEGRPGVDVPRVMAVMSEFVDTGNTGSESDG